MFKHVLVPTDGSRLAAKGIKAGVKLAKALGARVTAVYVVAPFRTPLYSEAALYAMPGYSEADYRKAAEKTAKKALAAVEIEAQTSGVRCDTRIVTHAQPWSGILKAARAGKCDAIAMASHGRAGVSGLILGSETQRVLAHSKLPVLVVR